MLSWDDFRYVKAIAQGRSLATAAHGLGVNHSTVFRRLAQIEGRLGSRLFERSRAGYTLTPAGEEMVRLAEQMENDIVAFERQVTGRDLRPSGELRITTTDGLVAHLLSGMFTGFRRAYPEITLEIVISNSSLNLSKRDADIAIRATDRAPETLVGRRAAVFGCAVYGRASEGGAGFDLAKAASYEWVGFGGDLAGIKMDQWLRGKVPSERIVYRVNTMLGAAAAIEAGIGLGVLPHFMGADRPGLTRMTPIIPGVGAELWLLTHPDLRQTARVRAFMDFAGAELAKMRRTIEGDGDAVVPQSALS